MIAAIHSFFLFRMQYLICVIVVLFASTSLAKLVPCPEPQVQRAGRKQCQDWFTADDAHRKLVEHVESTLDKATLNLFFDSLSAHVLRDWKPTERCVTMDLPPDDMSEPYATMRKHATLYESLVPAYIEAKLGFKVAHFRVVKHQIMISNCDHCPEYEHGNHPPSVRVCWRNEDYIVWNH